MIFARGLAFPFSVCVIMAIGCNESGKVPVKGTVVLPDGSPANGVMVSFSNPTTRTSAFGLVDEHGKYQLTTDHPDDGAVPGMYVVTVTQAGPKDSSEADPPRLFPLRYENADSSRLKFEVKPEKNSFDIRLESE